MDNIHKYFYMIAFAGGGNLAASKAVLRLVLVRCRADCQGSHLPDVPGEGDHVEVLVDVVHDLGLEEDLCCIGNVLSELLDSSASALCRAVLVNHLVALPLRSFPVWKDGDELLDHLKLPAEQGVLLHVHRIAVHLQQVQVHTRDSLYEALEGSVDLELLEETGSNAASGGPGQANLVVEDDRGVDGAAHHGGGDGVKVNLVGGGGVANGHPDVHQAGELLQ